MNYLPYVNIKQGTASTHRYSNGNTLPLVQRPFAMCGFAPQTSGDLRWYFHPNDHSIEGIRLTHQPSPWIADYGTLIFHPQKFRPYFGGEERWSGYRPAEAVMTPCYMKLGLLKSRSVFELTPTERGCAIRVSYSDLKENWFSVLPRLGTSKFSFDAEKETLTGYVTNCHDDKAVDFRMYFVIAFDKGQIDAANCIIGNAEQESSGTEIAGDNVGIHLKVSGTQLNCRIATSYISEAQAWENFRQDHEGKNFDTIRKENETLWESYLSRVEIEAFSEKQMKTFYSCMYRAFLFPHKCYEITSEGKTVHYSPCDGKTREGVRYTDNGFWDTYRTCYPFYAIAAKEEYKEMCRAFVNDYRECGWLPRWPSIGERGCMPSTLIDAVLADAVVKGIMDNETAELALEGMIKHSKTDSPDDDYGRSGAESYCKYGYVPLEVHRESVNLTADAAYGDWCIAVIAEKLGKTEIAGEYYKRAANYKNIFDPETGFMRPKHLSGEFRAEFSPTAWGRDYTEGSAWQNSFAVPHDMAGLAELYGGTEKLMEKIDELFATPPIYESVGYNCEIHEETEMAAVDFGQCAISNQPSFHLPYIYSELGCVEKTSYWVKKICEELFSYEDDGFPGDEDNGSMALWYVFSSIGLYPFCPGKNEYVRTKKLVRSVKINGVPFDADSFTGSKIPYIF